MIKFFWDWATLYLLPIVKVHRMEGEREEGIRAPRQPKLLLTFVYVLVLWLGASSQQYRDAVVCDGNSEGESGLAADIPQEVCHHLRISMPGHQHRGQASAPCNKEYVHGPGRYGTLGTETGAVFKADSASFIANITYIKIFLYTKTLNYANISNCTIKWED